MTEPASSVSPAERIRQAFSPDTFHALAQAWQQLLTDHLRTLRDGPPVRY
ncbi:MAG: hypothetical protein R3C19_07745 [Planctomycetaceae bacterium]